MVELSVEPLDGASGDYPPFLTFNKAKSSLEFNPQLIEYGGLTYSFKVVVSDSLAPHVRTEYECKIDVTREGKGPPFKSVQTNFVVAAGSPLTYKPPKDLIDDYYFRLEGNLPFFVELQEYSSQIFFDPPQFIDGTYNFTMHLVDKYNSTQTFAEEPLFFSLNVLPFKAEKSTNRLSFARSLERVGQIY